MSILEALFFNNFCFREKNAVLLKKLQIIYLFFHFFRGWMKDIQPLNEINEMINEIKTY